MFEQSSALLERVYLAAKAGRLANLPSTEAIAQDGLAKIAADRDLFVALGINPPPSEAPSRHGLHVAMLAMSIGTTMGYDDRTLVELGIGCLVHDIGMLRVERAGFQANRILGAADFKEIAKHPLYTFDLLKQQLDWLPRSARMVAYQMHERCNGSGYPRGRPARKIHDLAKVAAVADVFLALTSPRPHRPGLMPYYAVERILHGVKDGLFDPTAARAFVKTVSLFPVGSYVKLSDGRVGKVLRTNDADYSRPIVAAWQADKDESEAAVVVLATEAELRVTAAVTNSGPTPTS
jgi:HD-GYP domain-containing protein (c-di-GMP phosphodiesterase class II)